MMPEGMHWDGTGRDGTGLSLSLSLPLPLALWLPPPTSWPRLLREKFSLPLSLSLPPREKSLSACLLPPRAGGREQRERERERERASGGWGCVWWGGRVGRGRGREGEGG